MLSLRTSLSAAAATRRVSGSLNGHFSIITSSSSGSSSRYDAASLVPITTTRNYHHYNRHPTGYYGNNNGNLHQQYNNIGARILKCLNNRRTQRRCFSMPSCNSLCSNMTHSRGSCTSGFTANWNRHYHSNGRFNSGGGGGQCNGNGERVTQATDATASMNHTYLTPLLWQQQQQQQNSIFSNSRASIGGPIHYVTTGRYYSTNVDRGANMESSGATFTGEDGDKDAANSPSTTTTNHNSYPITETPSRANYFHMKNSYGDGTTTRKCCSQCEEEHSSNNDCCHTENSSSSLPNNNTTNQHPFRPLFIKYNHFLSNYIHDEKAGGFATRRNDAMWKVDVIHTDWKERILAAAKESSASNTTSPDSSSSSSEKEAKEKVLTDASSQFTHNGSSIIPNSAKKNRRCTDDRTLPLSSSYICLMLNRPVQHPISKKIFEGVWNHSAIRVCVDGAYRHFMKLKMTKKPHWICGDMDSVNWKNISFPSESAFATDNPVAADAVDHAPMTRWRKDPDQDTNDLQKAFKFLREDCQQDFNVIIWGSGGRMDHEMTNLNTMYIETKQSSVNRRIIIIGEENMMEVLCPGVHEIHPNKDVESGVCGLIPLSNPSYVSTSGLKWDLHNDKLEFGGLVSSSNEVVKDTVRIETSDPILWVSVLNLGMNDGS